MVVLVDGQILLGLMFLAQQLHGMFQHLQQVVQERQFIGNFMQTIQ
ncbi:hypothetical protein ES703_88901 [subsurface metagenome]